MTLRIIDTFSGIGGFSLAARWLGGFQTVQFVEWEPYCQRILAQHFPDTPIHGDITTFYPEQGAADVICGGFPCQDISTAGKQAGIKQGTRSGLFYELMRVVRTVRPRYVVMENVAAITSNGLDTVLGELAQAGFDAEWACIPASAVGACHQRDRWWLVAYANDTGHDCSSQCGNNKCGSQTIQNGIYPLIEPSGCFDATPNTQSSGRGARTGQGAGETGHEEPRAGDHGARSNAADPNGQRQQEQHTAAVADRQGWPRWSDAPRRLNSDWRSYLSEPVLCRGDDGLSGRVDRLKALGNAVVPQVAMIPLQRVLDHHNARSSRR
jgi:DNA (cytosine-5)-methyltransferase 1